MAKKQGKGQASRQWKGVRKRAWGRWVCEIRQPFSRERIWLGSYATAEEAAHAYDAASLCLRGPSASLNFPTSTIAPLLLSHSRFQRRPLSKTAIQSIAAAAAAEAAAADDLTADPQESQAPISISSPQELIQRTMDLPFDEMQHASISPQQVPLQGAAAPIAIATNSPQLQSSTHHQIHSLSQGSNPMDNHKGLPYQFETSHSEAPVHIGPELCSRSLSPSCISEVTAALSLTLLGPSPDPSAPQPSMDNWHLAIPAMARHFQRKAQMRSTRSSHPIVEAEAGVTPSSLSPSKAEVNL